jgi:hypothetical protein
MTARASVFALAIFSAAPEAAALASDGYETVVIAPPAKAAGEAGLSTAELRQIPGSQGDAGKALENLPGVARPGLAGGELVVWGAAALVQDGVGRAYGAQILLRFSPHPALSGWLAYTLSRSERRHSSESSYRLLDQVQPHLLTFAAHASRGGFVLGVRFRLASGMPRTPVTGSYLDATTGQFQPIFGQQNSIRLPVFYALDLRVEEHFRRSSLDIVPYLEILNLSNHANVEEFAYDEQFASRSNITGLPILAVAGVSVRF